MYNLPQNFQYKVPQEHLCWPCYLVLLVGLTLFIAEAQLSRGLGLLNYHHLEASTCQPLCILMVVLLWKPAVGLLTLQATPDVTTCFCWCCLVCKPQLLFVGAMMCEEKTWAPERRVKVQPAPQPLHIRNIPPGRCLQVEGLKMCREMLSLSHLHVHQAEDLYTHMGVHLKHFIKLAHLEQHGGVKVACLEFPPGQVWQHVRG